MSDDARISEIADHWYSAEQTRDDVRYLLARVEALAAERDEWKRINQSDNQCAARRLEQAESERDALAARFDEQVRRAGEGRGMSDYAVCAECGVFTNCDEIDAAYLPERDEWTCGPCVRKGDES